jgi:hexokinase
VRWTKGFSIPDGIAHNPVEYLEEALRAEGLQGRVAVLCNDSVAALGAGAYLWHDTCISLILGTGEVPPHFSKADGC